MKLIRYRHPNTTVWPAIPGWDQLEREMDRLFSWTSPLGGRVFRSPTAAWGPPMDVAESEQEYAVTLELPGMSREDIEVRLEEGVLTVAGERKLPEPQATSQLLRSERFNGRFERTLELPIPVKADAIRAAYQDGVLTITLPKVEEARPRRIEVSAH